MLLPCRHLSMCAVCAADVSMCPMCRSAVGESMGFYYYLTPPPVQPPRLSANHSRHRLPLAVYR